MVQTQVYDIEAPCVISNAGLKNTFQKLLPKNVAERSYFHKLSTQLRPSWGTFQVRYFQLFIYFFS